MLWTLDRFVGLAFATFAALGIVMWLVLRQVPDGDLDAFGLAASFFIGSGIFHSGAGTAHYTIRQFGWIIRNRCLYHRAHRVHVRLGFQA